MGKSLIQQQNSFTVRCLVRYLVPLTYFIRFKRLQAIDRRYYDLDYFQMLISPLVRLSSDS